ncbi:MAG TPA: glucosidase, partial [Planctomycetota bacterium]|nr:glucosidase [Planctomycetota bacterium]
RRRSRREPEFELEDTGVFDGNRYFDVFAEYAKAAPDDVLIRLTIANRGPEPAEVHVLPTLWFRNTWSWGRTGEGYWPEPRISLAGPGEVLAEHASLGAFRLLAEGAPPLLFTDNETNAARLYGSRSRSPFPKDAFHDHVVDGRPGAVNPRGTGTKAATHYRLSLPAGGEAVLQLRLFPAAGRPATPFGAEFEATFDRRRAECDAFHASIEPASLADDERRIIRQGRAGLLWTKQFYHFVVADWLDGDPAYPPPAPGRGAVRNGDWAHLFNRDVISMPDKWEYPWYAAWDLAFHMIPFARMDPVFAKQQLVLLLREWYMHPNGQVPAYEWNFSDANPPVHAWACWRVYKITGPRGGRDRQFLSRVFKKLLVNFTWWVNRKDLAGKHIFSGGFLGLDNVGVFDRSKPLPTGGVLAQADGTAWMAFYCTTMLAIALELARDDPSYEDIASKFFEHFVAIADAMNTLGGTGLWDEEDGFYYDQLHAGGAQGGGPTTPLRIRSMVGLVPLFAVEVLEQEAIDALPGFRKRLAWFLENRRDLARQVSYLETPDPTADRHAGHARRHGHRLLAIPSRERLVRVLRHLL